jgi:hypothetical protein
VAQTVHAAGTLGTITVTEANTATEYFLIKNGAVQGAGCGAHTTTCELAGVSLAPGDTVAILVNTLGADTTSASTWAATYTITGDNAIG